MLFIVSSLDVVVTLEYARSQNFTVYVGCSSLHKLFQGVQESFKSSETYA